MWNGLSRRQELLFGSTQGISGDESDDGENKHYHYLAKGIGGYGPNIPSQLTQEDVERAVFNKANYMYHS